MALTEKEKLVLYGLVRWPGLNDTGLSGEIDVNRSTVTAIRSRLMKEKYLTELYMPDLQQIGCEILTVIHSDFNPLATFQVRKRYATVIRERFKDYFLGMATDTQRVLVAASQNFTELHKQMAYAEKTYWQHNFLTWVGNVYAFFPLSQSYMMSFFDYSRPLRDYFELDIPEDEDPSPTALGEKEPADLSERERELLYIFVRHGGIMDKKAASMLGVSKSTVSIIRRRFREDGLIRRVYIPDIKKLGFELMVFHHTRHNPTHPYRERMKRVREAYGDGMPKWLTDHIFHISSDLEAVSFDIFKNYTHFQDVYGEYLRLYKAEDFFMREPTIKIFPLKDLTPMSEIRFDLLVQHILGIKTRL
jgi:DNA-binding MarR family transcriptional regulator